MDRHDLTDAEWALIAPLLPTKVRGVARMDDRRVIDGILWRFRRGTHWRDFPHYYRPADDALQPLRPTARGRPLSVLA